MKLPKLNLRDAFWLVLVWGLAVGWGVDRQRLGRLVDALNQSALAAGYDLHEDGSRAVYIGPE